jgi:hypothetical protein
MLFALHLQRNHPRLRKAGKVAAWLVVFALALTGMSFLSDRRPTPPLPLKYRTQLGTIPELGIKATSLNFYAVDNPANRQRFLKSQTSSVVSDLRLEIIEGYATKAFNINYVIYGPDGPVSAPITMEINLQPKYSNVALTYGWTESGNWKAGVYLVEVYYQEILVAAGVFEVVENCFIVGKYTVCITPN